MTTTPNPATKALRRGPRWGALRGRRRAARRWPQFTADADTAGIRSFLAARLGNSDTRIGALNLDSHDPDGFTPADHDLLLVIAHHASRPD